MAVEPIPFNHLVGLSFGVYSDSEIEKLSVKELTNPQTFDALMHPTYGGLYDPALGPSDRNDVCETCGQTSMHCPGHMGCIKLPVPVFNPVFFKHLFALLRGTCFNCHRISVVRHRHLLTIKQFELLEHGLVSEVESLRDIYNGIVAEFGQDAEVEAMVERELNNLIKQTVQEFKEGLREGSTKNVTEVKQALVKEFMAEFFGSKIKKCPYCTLPSRAMRAEQNSKIFFYASKKKSKKAALALAKVAEMQKRKKEQQLRGREDEENGDLDEMEVVEEGEDTQTPSAAVLQKKGADTQTEYLDQTVLSPMDAQSHMREVWSSDGDILQALFGALNIKMNKEKYATDVFFLNVVPVSPPRFRPIARMRDMCFDNPQTANLSKVLSESIVITRILNEMGSRDISTDITEIEKQNTQSSLDEIPGQSLPEKLQNTWVRLQTRVNCVIDSDLDKLNTDKVTGIKQLLEKKEGLFRKHMMGKRVNYAARSVISPDPYINTDEIGVPAVFATRLTYPQPVTPWNVHELRQMVINGPAVHPGACFVEHEDGKRVMLRPNDKTAREAIAKQLLTPSTGNVIGSKKVYRHIKNGDIMLLNRQPTLHRPSIQAHKARILKGEKTLRMHYSNCKAYNADFDGDEMNAHFPQNELARAEAYTIASTNFQYLVPKDGTPLAGLIQDHMVSGVSLTIRGKFFNRSDYQQLIFAALTDKNGRVKTLSPAFLKPTRMWSGKQVLSTVLLNIIPDGKALLNLDGKSKIPIKNWMNGESRHWLAGGTPLAGDAMSECEVVIREGQLLCGVLDKAHYGNTPYGLVHCCYELYGGEVAGKLLTCLARLFTTYLQMRGFTLGVEDILCTRKADKKRRKIMVEGQACGPEAAAKALNVADHTDLEEIKKKYQAAHLSKDDGFMKDLDLCMKGMTDKYQNEIAKVIMPQGLHKRFPHNNLQLMVQSGAKGSSVNCMQISCLLGQIELEGRRPPIMVTGRSLPCFLPYDTSPRSGGFIDGRFLTGIRPQEYFFHCMAGREGLVDTAVKTSRSGYLQRCIIKHLEGITVNYDLTVRDSDGSIIQFQYGEDNLDILKTQYLKEKQFPFLIKNREAVFTEEKLQEVSRKTDTVSAENWVKKVGKWYKQRKKGGISRLQRTSGFLNFCNKKFASVIEEVPLHEMDEKFHRSLASLKILETWKNLDPSKKLQYSKHHTSCPDPVMAVLRPDRHVGSIPETLQNTVKEYIKTNPDKLVEESDVGRITPDTFKKMMHMRCLTSLVEPGEAVGLLAAQSIGEPSTQMTLNTFHFAGRGEMNVTLGIPRLREILMVASVHIKTPNMDIPIFDNPQARAKAKKLQQSLNKVYLSQVLEDVQVTEYLSVRNHGDRCRVYRIKFSFLPKEAYDTEVHLPPGKILWYMEKMFFRNLTDSLRKKLNEISEDSLLESQSVRPRAQKAAASEAPKFQPAGAAEEEEEVLSEDDQNDGDTTAVKNRERQVDEGEYDGEEEERRVLGDELDDDNSDEEGEELEDEFELSTPPDSDVSRPSTPQPSDSAKKNKKNRRRSVKEMDKGRIGFVLNVNSQIDKYTYDADDEISCELTLKLGIVNSKIDMTTLIENEARKAVVHQVAGITRCIVSESKTSTETRLKTEGVNIHEMYKYSDFLDLNQLYSNDIHAIANTYGIEAAGRVLRKEIKNVFAAYGIEVDYRHLSLVGDYMTFEGKYKPFNRVGIESNASPLQKMTFETTMAFLKTATILGARDDLKSPSARLVVGSLVNGGTGAVEIQQPIS